MNAFDTVNPLYESSEFMFVGKHPSFPESDVYENRNKEFGLTHPLPTSQQIIDFYKSGFYIKDDNLSDFNKRLEFAFQRSSAQIDFIEPFIRSYSNCSVLDIGCSDGSLLKLLQERGFSVAGYEPDLRMATFANERLVSHTNGDCIVKNKIFDDIQLEDNVYDLVCSSHVLEHVSDPVNHLRQLKGVLRKNGKLFMEIPNQYGLGIKNCITPSIFPSAKMQGHLYFYSPNSIKEILEQNGFKVLCIMTCGRNVKDVFSVHQHIHHKNKKNLIEKLRKKVLRGIKHYFYEVPKKIMETKFMTKKTADQDTANVFKTYWEGDEEGQWIRLIAEKTTK